METFQLRGVGEGATNFSWVAPPTLDPYVIMLDIKWGIKYNFLSRWYDLTMDWTPVYRAIGKYSYHYVNSYIYVYLHTHIYAFVYAYIYIYIHLFNKSLITEEINTERFTVKLQWSM